MKINQILILALLLSLSSCSIKHVDKGEEPEPENPDPEPSAEFYFKATINDQYLQGPDDTGFSFMVETNMTEDEWTVQTDADWLQITKSSTDICIVPSEYDPRREDNGDHEYPAPRSASVTVDAGTVFSKTFTVIQESWTFISSEYAVELLPSGETATVTVRHNCVSWTPQTDADWLTFDIQDASTLSITSSARSADNTDPRSAVVRLQSDRDEQTFWDITVTDAESGIGSEDFNYGDHTDWD